MARSKQPAMPTYLPPSMTGGNLPGTPQAGFPSPVGKSRSIQMMGNLSGRPTAGMTRGMYGPDQQFRNAFGHYGKPRGSSLK